MIVLGQHIATVSYSAQPFFLQHKKGQHVAINILLRFYQKGYPMANEYSI